jgi:hypothetical protein
MYLEGKVQTAKVSDFGDGLQLVVVDRQVVKPAGGRPQYTIKLVRGWPGLDELRQLKKGGAAVQELVEYGLQHIQLPQEDQVIPLTVLDITGKQGYKTLICEITAEEAA